MHWSKRPLRPSMWKRPLPSNIASGRLLIWGDVSYTDIKKYVYNSIDYSFIKEESVKEKLKSDLDSRFNVFEYQVISIHNKR